MWREGECGKDDKKDTKDGEWWEHNEYEYPFFKKLKCYGHNETSTSFDALPCTYTVINILTFSSVLFLAYLSSSVRSSVFHGYFY